MKPLLRIEEISAVETYGLRQGILRPGKPISECHFEGDIENTSFHLGIYQNNKLTGVTSFMKSSSPLFEVGIQYRMRGMAILKESQKQGLGDVLLKAGEQKLKIQNKKVLIWFNARESAMGFYSKNGYKTKGEKFEIPGVCTHIVMWKKL